MSQSLCQYSYNNEISVIGITLLYNQLLQAPHHDLMNAASFWLPIIPFLQHINYSPL